MGNLISFFQTNKISCPICSKKFSREIMRTGGGRIIAGKLKIDLRREYEKSSKYGYVYPLIYNPVVCPNCFYSALPEDFSKVPKEIIPKILANEASRKEHANMIFGDFNYESEHRNLTAGAKGFFLGVSCYAYFPKEFAPSTKKAICAIRASWCIDDLYKQHKNENYETIYQYFRFLAFKCYEKSIETMTSGEEDFGGVSHLGPDTDVNFGYEGTLYTSAYLGYELKNLLDEKILYQKLKDYRTQLAKVFGFGKSSKEKPTPLLNHARDLHELIGKEIDSLKEIYK